MKLEKYLADYLATGIERLHEQGMPMDFDADSLQEIIKYGLDTFESSKLVHILIAKYSSAHILSWFETICKGIRMEYEDGASERDLIIDKNTLLELLEVE